MNKQKEILKWSLALDSTASILTLCVGIYLGISFLNLICLVPILINLYILKFLINKNLDKATIFTILNITFSIYLIDTGLSLNLGTYLFYIPTIIGIYLFDALGSKSIKKIGLLACAISIILVNIGWSPQLLFKPITEILELKYQLYYNTILSVSVSILILQTFGNLRKEAMAEIELKQANNLALLENSNDAIWSIDENLKLVSFNSNYAAMFREFWQIEAKPGMDILFNNSNPKVYNEWKAWYRRVLQGESFNFDIAYDFADGQKIFEISFSPIFKDKKVQGAVIKSIDVTHRKTAYEKQQLIAQNLELLLSSTQEIIFEMNEHDTCAKVWKGENLKMFYPDEYFLGKTIEQLFDEPFGTKMGIPFQITKNTGIAQEYEYAYPVNGITKYYLAKLRRIKNSDPAKVSVVIEDISLRKEAEIAQTQQSDFLNKLIAHLPIGVFVKHVKNGLTYTLWNKELETLFNLKEAEVIGKTDEEVFKNAGEISHYLATDQLILRDKEPILIQKLCIQTEDKPIFARTFKIPLLDANGEVESILGILENITDVVHSQEELAIAEKRWNYALSGSRDAVWDVNLVSNETFFSPVFSEMLGYKAYEQLSETWEDLVHPDDLPKAWNLFVDHLEGLSHFYECEYRLRKKDQSYFWVLDRGKVAETDADGNPTRVIGTFSNIDYRKKLEAEYKQALQKAEEASHAKSLFLSTMSHEIRTPLNGVIGFINLLLMDQPNPKQLENLNALKYSADNLLFMLNDILDFSKIDAGKMDLEVHPFNLIEILQNTSKSFVNAAKEKGLSLQLKASKEIPELLLGDALRISQILNNLLSNAIKFTETGEVGIMAICKQIRDEKATISFEIWDTGIGIEPEYLPHLFEQFTQASSDTTRKYGGTGLGLAICKKLVEIMGGNLHVKSEKGQGTRFSFNLTLAVAQVNADDTPKIDFSGNADFTGMQILLVEDNQINVLVAKQLLMRWKIMVDVAQNGKDALVWVQRKKYDLILMDLQMPEMDGFESAATMRKGGIQTPIFALSANVNSDAREKVLASGMNDYISKPFKPAELAEKINAIFVQKKTKKTKEEPPQNTLF
ncbi:MAG: ATP-binding protein [Bacteroidota bacterium]|nr:ATP-binding protein [Bacteroidota bacterium]